MACGFRADIMPKPIGEELDSVGSTTMYVLIDVLISILHLIVENDLSVLYTK